MKMHHALNIEEGDGCKTSKLKLSRKGVNGQFKRIQLLRNTCQKKFHSTKKWIQKLVKNVTIPMLWNLEHNITVLGMEKGIWTEVFWTALVLTPFMISSVFQIVVLVKYFAIFWYVAVPLSCVSSALIWYFVCHSRVFQGAFYVTLLEIFPRIFRILLACVAFLFSPLKHVQQNMTQFFRAIACCVSNSLNAGKNATEEMMAQAIKVTEEITNTANDISTTITEVFLPPITYVSQGLSEISKFVLSAKVQYDYCMQGINSFGNACIFSVNAVADKCYEAVDGILSFLEPVCDTIDSLIEHCGVLEHTGVCTPFRELSKLGELVNDLKVEIDKAKDELNFTLKVQYEIITKLNNQTIHDMKDGFEKSFMEKIDTWMLISNLFGFVIGTTILWTLYKKTRVVKKYFKGDKINIDPISKVIVASNPFTAEVIVSIVFLLVEYIFRHAYYTIRNNAFNHDLEASTSFNASVTSTGGSLGTYLAKTFTDSLRMYASIDLTVNLGSCLIEDMQSPSWICLPLLITFTIAGFMTYRIDKYVRTNQEEMLRVIYFCSDSIFV